jgi:imidazolonepropionase-like amidohydrolase
VEIIFGGDVGVFPHGQNVKELFLMNEYGMTSMQALKCATSGNAESLQFKNKGRLKAGFLADIIACKGDPISDLHVLSNVTFVMKSGKVIKQ